ncbi:hypothetical protein MTO96_037870 [Rhipicephalus appendiculatus]
MVGGIDGPSISMQLHLVIFGARRNDLQRRVQREIDAVIGHRRLPTWEDRKLMPFTLACVWELERWKRTEPFGLPRAKERALYNSTASAKLQVDKPVTCLKMSYAIVEFMATKEVEIVPVTWVSNTKCCWPNVKAEKASRMAKKRTPPQESWKYYEISLKGLFGTYEHARKNISRSQFTSDLGSDPEGVPKKRCRRPPKKWTESDSDADEKEEAATTKNPVTLPAIPKDFPLDILQHMLRLLNTIRFMLQQQADSINRLCEMLPSAPAVTCTPLVVQPFNSLQELFDFDAKLTRETTTTLVREFMQLGGKDANCATKRILGYCLSDKLAAQFSWLGRKGKHSFSALNIAKAVACAASKAPKGSAADIEEAVKSWLRHAPERLLSKSPKMDEQCELQQTGDSN